MPQISHSARRKRVFLHANLVTGGAKSALKTGETTKFVPSPYFETDITCVEFGDGYIRLSGKNLSLIHI